MTDLSGGRYRAPGEHTTRTNGGLSASSNAGLISWCPFGTQRVLSRGWLSLNNCWEFYTSIWCLWRTGGWRWRGCLCLSFFATFCAGERATWALSQCPGRLSSSHLRVDKTFRDWLWFCLSYSAAFRILRGGTWLHPFVETWKTPQPNSYCLWVQPWKQNSWAVGHRSFHVVGTPHSWKSRDHNQRATWRLFWANSKKCLPKLRQSSSSWVSKWKLLHRSYSGVESFDSYSIIGTLSLERDSRANCWIHPSPVSNQCW